MPVKQLTPAQAAAARARQEAAAISPTVAAQMGAAMAPTYDFNPNAAPNDLPEPGSAPSGAPRGGPRPETFGKDAHIGPGLPDDREALRAAGLLSDDPPPPAQQVSQRPVQRTVPADPTQHPLLRKLRQDLGIDQVESHEVKIGKHRWRLATLSAGDLAMATRLADQMSESVAEHQLVYMGATAAHAVVAIDDVPTYQVFGVQLAQQIPITNPLRPPRMVRQLAAAQLYDFISDGRTALPQRLYEAYIDRCDADGAVDSYLDDPTNKRMKFRCEQEGCDHVLTVAPRYAPGTQDIVMPFCQWHGTAMALENDDPLA